MNDPFENYIGQEPAIQRIRFYLKGYEDTSVFPNILFISQKGDGKTRLARAIADSLRNAGEKKGFKKGIAEFNCATITKPEEWIRAFGQGIKGCNGTVFLDELHALHPTIVNWLLSVLESGNLVNTVNGVDYDFRRLTFIAATTERQKLFVPFLNRFKVIDLCAYTEEEKEKILRLHVQGVDMSGDIAKRMVSFTRGNARSVVDMAQEITRYCSLSKIDRFQESDAKTLISILDCFPLGLSRLEVNILKIVRERGGVGLTAMCAATGLTRAAQMDMETYMLRHGLMELDSSKRKITPKGIEYLDGASPVKQTPPFFN